MATIKQTQYTHRFLARFIIEANTPLAVGSGEKDIITDALVATDVNGLPHIPGTAISGVVRSMLTLQGVNTDQFFGFQNENNGEGSQIIFTEAKIINSKGAVIDGMHLEAIDDALLRNYKELPIRQHVRIDGRGTAVKAGKFDEQVVFAGTRFCFELEMVAKDKNTEQFDSVLSQLQNKTFRIGGGTRCGFGEIKVIDYKRRILDLREEDQLDLYLTKTSDLSEEWKGWEKQSIEENANVNGWTRYELVLQPVDFFMFGSGLSDSEADMTPVKGKRIDWSNGKGELRENLVLIPASSVKGALAHRVAYHYNVLNQVYAEDLHSDKERQAVIGKNNEAVKLLFGSEGEIVDGKMVNPIRGNVIISDVIESPLRDKIINHVAIDRYTGGAIDGALFTEKTTYGRGQSYTFTILVNDRALKGGSVEKALESSMKDICQGRLPLGGGVNRGNGVFSGSLTKNGEVVYENK